MAIYTEKVPPYDEFSAFFQSLRIIDLKLTDEEANRLASIVQQHPTLSELDVTGKTFSAQAMKTLIDATKVKGVMRWLHLGWVEEPLTDFVSKMTLSPVPLMISLSKEKREIRD